MPQDKTIVDVFRSSSLSEQTESVEANPPEAVTGSGVIDEFVQLESRSKVRARDEVGQDANGARLNDSVALGVGTLVVGRDASVAQGVAHQGPPAPYRSISGRFHVHTLSFRSMGSRPSSYSSIYSRSSRNRNHRFRDAPMDSGRLECRHHCGKRSSGFPPTSLRWSATSFWPMMI